MDWIKKLSSIDLTESKFSQYGEDVIIKRIFENINPKINFFVDIGAGGAGKGLSNTKLLKECGWSGLSFDMDGSDGLIKEFITPFNICSVLKKYECPTNFDFLSVDLDSFDYDIIESLLREYKPVLICAEYNATIPPDVPVKLEYEEGYTWDGTNKYGFSFSAGVKLFEKFGYTVILSHADTNMFAIKTELLKGFKPEIKAKQNVYHPININAKFITV